MARRHTFRVDALPVPKGRPRVTRHGTYTPQRTRDWERLIGLAYNGPMFQGDVSVELHIDLPDHRRRDIDNLVKSCLDGLTGRAYPDDGRVVQVFARKYVNPRNVGMWCTVEEA